MGHKEPCSALVTPETRYAPVRNKQLIIDVARSAITLLSLVALLDSDTPAVLSCNR
jgi:hypothetical protein